jgi:predicted nucleic acid-binding protein
MFDDTKLTGSLSVHELLVVATALKSAKEIINAETNRNSMNEGIDEALEIVERIINSK